MTAKVPEHHHREYATDEWIRNLRTELRDADAALADRITALESTDPVPGPQGEAGPPGPKGDTGPVPTLADLGLVAGSDGIVRVATTEPPIVVGPTPHPGLASGAVTLQQAVDASSAGDTIVIPAVTLPAGATIDRALALVGVGSATIDVPAARAGLAVAADGVTIEGVTLTGPGDTVAFELGSRGITCSGSSGDRISGLVVRGCSISMFRGFGMRLSYTAGALIEGNTVLDVVYAGIMLLSDSGSVVQDNVVRRIGDEGVYPSPAAIYNAYGIVTTDEGSNRSTGTIIRRNTVSDVPTWHGLDTHGGTNHQWIDNHVSRCNRAIFITSSYTSAGPQVISGNRLDEPTPRPDVAGTYPYNMRAITIASGGPVTGTGNVIDGFPSGAAISGSHSLVGTTVTGTLAP